jgi:hypothetical protein
VSCHPANKKKIFIASYVTLTVDVDICHGSNNILGLKCLTVYLMSSIRYSSIERGHTRSYITLLIKISRLISMKELVKKNLWCTHLSALHISFLFLSAAKKQLRGLATCDLLTPCAKMPYQFVFGVL